MGKVRTALLALVLGGFTAYLVVLTYQSFGEPEMPAAIEAGAKATPLAHYNRGVKLMVEEGADRNYAEAYAHLKVAVGSGALPGDLPKMAGKYLEALKEKATPEEITKGEELYKEFTAKK